MTSARSSRVWLFREEASIQVRICARTALAALALIAGRKLTKYFPSDISDITRRAAISDWLISVNQS
jgi:hypothetical protein